MVRNEGRHLAVGGNRIFEQREEFRLLRTLQDVL